MKYFIFENDDPLLVPSKSECVSSRIKNNPSIEFRAREVTTLEITPSYSCHQIVERLEHVIIELTIDLNERGSLKLKLISPVGTESIILDKRPNDDSNEGFQEFEFLSVHFWNEIISSDKKWRLEIENSATVAGYVTLLDLILHGTAQE